MIRDWFWSHSLFFWFHLILVEFLLSEKSGREIRRGNLIFLLISPLPFAQQCEKNHTQTHERMRFSRAEHRREQGEMLLNGWGLLPWCYCHVNPHLGLFAHPLSFLVIRYSLFRHIPAQKLWRRIFLQLLNCKGLKDVLICFHYILVLVAPLLNLTAHKQC